MKHTDDEPPFLVFGAPDVQDAEIDEMVATLRSGWIGTGPRTTRFEEAFRTYRKAEYAVAVNSCTAALHLSLVASGVGPGDEVITTPLTFCATVNAIIHAGATPVLADVDPRTMNIDPEAVQDAITPRTRALLPVHFAGRPCNMGALMDIVADHELRLVEDCAHAVETEHRGRPAGTFGDFGCFSFYATKNVVTGEGGMVLTRGRENAARIKTLALHGMSQDAWKRFGDSGYKHYQVVEAGFKYNMTDMQAALGIHQLARVEENWQRRKAIWSRYMDAFADEAIGLPAEPEPDTRHAFHLFTVMVDPVVAGCERDALLQRMTARRIGVGVHYVSIPEHPFYQQRFGWRPDDWPEAKRIGRETVSLPLGPGLTDAEVERVITAVKGSLQAA